MNTRAFFSCLLFMLTTSVLLAQNSKALKYTGEFGLSDDNKSYILTDSLTLNTYTLDSAHVCITARDKNGLLLWHTNVRDDNNIPTYRSCQAINNFRLAKNFRDGMKEEIFINFHNSQFGYLEKNTGRFHFLGQD